SPGRPACPPRARAATIPPPVPTPAARRNRRLFRPWSSAVRPLLCRPVGMGGSSSSCPPVRERPDSTPSVPNRQVGDLTEAGCLPEPAEDGDDLAEDLGVVPVDGVEGGVV